MIGKYERGEAIPSVDAAKKITDALSNRLFQMKIKIFVANFATDFIIFQLSNWKFKHPNYFVRFFQLQI